MYNKRLQRHWFIASPDICDQKIYNSIFSSIYLCNNWKICFCHQTCHLQNVFDCRIKTGHLVKQQFMEQTLESRYKYNTQIKLQIQQARYGTLWLTLLGWQLKYTHRGNWLIRKPNHFLSFQHTHIVFININLIAFKVCYQYTMILASHYCLYNGTLDSGVCGSTGDCQYTHI